MNEHEYKDNLPFLQSMLSNTTHKMSYTITITYSESQPSTKKITLQETSSLQNGEAKMQDILERSMEYMYFLTKLPADLINKKIEHHVLFNDGKYIIDSQKVHFSPMEQFSTSISAIPINGRFYTLVPSGQIDSFRPIQYHQPLQNSLQLID